MMTDGSPVNNLMGAVAEIIGSAHSGKRPLNRDTAEEMQDVGSKGESSMTMSCPKGERVPKKDMSRMDQAGWTVRAVRGCQDEKPGQDSCQPPGIVKQPADARNR